MGVALCSRTSDCGCVVLPAFFISCQTPQVCAGAEPGTPDTGTAAPVAGVEGTPSTALTGADDPGVCEPFGAMGCFDVSSWKEVLVLASLKR